MIKLFALPTLTALILLNSATTLADGNARQYNIPAQSLNNAMMQFAADSNLKLLFTADTVRGMTTNGLDGSMTSTQALSKLLQGSGMTYRFVDANTVTIETPSGNLIKAADTGQSYEQHSGGEGQMMPKVTVESEAIPEDEIEDYYNPNYAGTNSFYKRSNSNTATKTDTPIIENPVSIQVVSRAIMDDQKNNRIKDALENVSGVRAQPSLGFGTGFIIRGFRTNRTYRNGLVADANLFATSDFDTANLESVDVLKGPAAVLFGRIEPGGLVNLNTKKPMEAPYYSLEQQFGNYDFYRTQWDATGSISGDNELTYRLSGSYQNNNSFRDLISSDRVMVSPTLTWRPTDSTDLSINVEGVEQEFQADFGIPAVNVGTGNGRPAPISISSTMGDTNDPLDQLSKVYIGTEINHRFNDDWAIHNRFLMTRTNSDTTILNPADAFDPASLKNNRFLERNIYYQKDEVEGYSTNLDLTGKFDIGSSSHNVLAGFDFTEFHTGYHTLGDWLTPNPALTIDIYNPQASYGIDPALYKQTLATNVTDPDFGYYLFKDQWYGAYFQDQITLWDKLHILGGGRYDWAETGRGSGNSFAVATDNMEHSSSSNLRKDEGFSPRVGILYEPWHFLSVYGSWTTSFNANNGVSDSGETFDPERGEQFEAGIKTSLFDDRLLATLAYYHLTKDNILVQDPSPPTNNPFAKVSNNQRSQGIELDISGQVTDQISLIASYAFTDAKVLKDNVALGDPDNTGHSLPLVPDHSGSLWLKYDHNGSGSPHGFSFGLGAFASGARQGDFENSFQLPGYVRMDAFAAYKLKVAGAKITTQFNIRNILEKEYYESTDPFSTVAPALAIAPGAPLTAIGSIRVEY
jgi:iron complex outermembrane recepter protein